MRPLVVVGPAIWLLIVCAGLRILLSYSFTPGAAGDAPAQWPSGSRIPRAANLPTLVMVAHPQCPCTKASLGELELAMARLRGRLAARVIFYQPQNAPADWKKSDLWDKASAIPGVTAAWDGDGAEARRFGAATSGHVVLYNAQGRLLFSGGITASRGHSGDNAGLDAVISAVSTGAAGKAPVFGCSLLDTRFAPVK